MGNPGEGKANSPLYWLLESKIKLEQQKSRIVRGMHEVHGVVVCGRIMLLRCSWSLHTTLCPH